MGAVIVAGKGADLVARVRREVTRRLVAIEVPEPGFDPLKGTDAELARFRLPPRPDRAKEPEEYRQWVELFTRPPGKTLNFIRPMFNFQASHRLRMAPRQLGGGHLGGSRNWSGAYIVPSHGRRFQHIRASWQVPEVKPPVPPGGGAPPDDEYLSSTWVGLDGHRGYSNGLPQIGTDHLVTVVGGIATGRRYRLWWQWWARGQQIPPVPIDNMPVGPGQSVTCWLTVVRPDRVEFLIRNHELGDVLTFSVDGPGPAPGAPDPVVLGTTAEWITERPTRLGSDDLHPLPDYGEVVFRNCRAWSGRTPGSIEAKHTLEAARLIRMYERRDGPRRATFLSMAKRPPASIRRVRTIYRGHQLWPE